MDGSTTALTWTAATFTHAVRLSYTLNHASAGVFAPHILYEPVLRCVAEQNSIDWGFMTGCFAETAGCMADAACTAAWDQAANLTKATMGMTFTYVSGGYQAIGAVAHTFLNDITDPANPVPMTELQLGVFNGFVDMANNGKASANIACMLNDWAGVDVGAAYPLSYCFDVVNQCDQDAACSAAASEFASCANSEYSVEISAGVPLWPNLMAVMPADATHQQWCDVGACAAEAGNSMFMAAAMCNMDLAGFQYKKCYDDMMTKVKMLAILVGGVSFVVGVLVFTGIWCVACKPSKASATNV